MSGLPVDRPLALNSLALALYAHLAGLRAVGNPLPWIPAGEQAAVAAAAGLPAPSRGKFRKAWGALTAAGLLAETERCPCCNARRFCVLRPAP